MRYFWMLFLTPLAIGVIATIFIYLQKTRKKTRDISKMAVIAHTKVIKELPAYKAAERNYHILLSIAAICLVTTLFSATVLASRPVKGELGKSRSESRDIVLCLDVSGSLETYQKAILSHYKSIIRQLKGERIGITIFDGRPANLIPLSDDYDTLYEMIDDLGESNFKEYVTTLNSGGLTSQVGSGLIGCVNSFDTLADSKRPQSIILATDNYSSNTDINIIQAANYAKSYGITVYGILAGENLAEGTTEAFKSAIATTGGIYYNLNKTTDLDLSAKEIVDRITAQEAAIYEGASEYTYNDAPEIWLIVSAISVVVFFIVIWRLHL
ncbi:VWA domain-containing protein [Candidatus Saccharibacteria bacterium]|nr:VWA domain-containing protein [Candidatus Saccharibacteria bacterium]